MKVYVQSKKGIPAGVNNYAAYLGFSEMGFETVLCEGPDSWESAQREDIVVGGLGFVRWRLRQLGVSSDEIDYPSELGPYMNRRVWQSTIDEVSCHPETWPVFVKSVEVNDGYSLGAYGLQHNLYAQLLSARWAELVGVDDPCDFGIEIPKSL